MRIMENLKGLGRVIAYVYSIRYSGYMKRDIRVLLHNIRSTHNVGSLFRTADAAGISHIYISGYTPSPLDQFNRKQKDIAKTALGAEDSVPWTKASQLKKLVAQLKIDGFSIVALEQNEKSVDYKKVK